MTGTLQETVARAEVEAVNRTRRPFFAKRAPIYPQRVDGRFRRFKWLIMAVTLGIYYITPWLRWDRGPHAPDQAVLIDFPGRRFYFFFIEIWPQEVYYVTGLLILAAIGLFLVTSLLGRAWCGYSCPQTVWTDLFLVVERFWEGRRNQRIKLDRGPWTLDKIARKAAKHASWLLIAVATGGAWVFYFADAPSLATQLVRFEAPAVAYAFVGLFTTTTYLLGGFAREQVCIYMCPWPRIQAAMMDAESLTVTYRRDRGEPRGPHKQGESWEGRGDCVSCRQCVVVCPMGIDIRDGAQLACINCALCIDACNAVMDKVGRPRGLIGYDTDANIARRARGEKPVYRLVRPRTVIYALLLLLVGGIMLYALANRSLVDVTIASDRTPLYVTLSDGRIQNAYTLKLLNKHRTSSTFTLRLHDAPEGASLSVIGAQESGGAAARFTVPGDDLRDMRVIVRLPRAVLTGVETPLAIAITHDGGGERIVKPLIFRGPS
ncbi:MAG: cytochrome c oxidase accessory protein CcoG [Alphaproteobacteria bacterium]|nr:MAG: cytochrome c oxidase accessory protein CcoG [Alphaproteobacteria bacterium]